MIKSILREKKLVIMVILTVLVKLFSMNRQWIERYYTYGFYPIISRSLRLAFGWIPFSMGDLLYAAILVYLLYKMRKYILLLKRRELKQYLSRVLLKKILKLLLGVYILFNVLWGLN